MDEWPNSHSLYELLSKICPIARAINDELQISNLCGSEHSVARTLQFISHL